MFSVLQAGKEIVNLTPVKPTHKKDVDLPLKNSLILEQPS